MTKELSPSAMALSGKVILDAATVIAGPLASGLLADFGADVIKIESPQGGDPMRHLGQSAFGQGTRSKVTNRNKRSMTLDLHYPEGRQIYLDLVKHVDVVITNFRLPTLEHWGLDYAQLYQIKPDIIMLHITGFGRTGPLSRLPSFAPVAEAFAGLAYISGRPDHPPQLSGGSIGDLMTGVYGAFATCLALIHKRNSGEGQLIDLSLYAPLLRTLETLVIDYELLGVIAERYGNEVSGTVPSNLYETRDGVFVAVAASTAQLFIRLCQALNLSEMANDPRFSSNETRLKYRREINTQLQGVIEKLTIDELTTRLSKFCVGFSIVNSARDLLNNEHIRSRGELVSIFDKNLNRNVVMPAPVPQMSRTPGQVRWVGPECGEDTDDILTSMLGMSVATIQNLRERKII